MSYFFTSVCFIKYITAEEPYGLPHIVGTSIAYRLHKPTPSTMSLVHFHSSCLPQIFHELSTSRGQSTQSRSSSLCTAYTYFHENQGRLWRLWKEYKRTLSVLTLWTHLHSWLQAMRINVQLNFVFKCVFSLKRSEDPFHVLRAARASIYCVCFQRRSTDWQPYG